MVNLYSILIFHWLNAFVPSGKAKSLNCLTFAKKIYLIIKFEFKNNFNKNKKILYLKM